MRTKKLTKKDRENLRSRKWLVFERSHVECLAIICKLRDESTTIEQRKRLVNLRKRIHKAFIQEAIVLGWQNEVPLFINHKKERTRLSIEAV